MVSNARTRHRGIMALSLFVFCLILLALPVPTEARVQLKIETSIEGDPGDGVLSPSGSARTADPDGTAEPAGAVSDPGPVPSYSPYRMPLMFFGNPAAAGPMLWLDIWSSPFLRLSEGRWLHASGSRN